MTNKERAETKFYLAPMEGVGDRPFRRAMNAVGGFDEACTSFIRVPINAHVKSLAKVYQHDELSPTPLVAQIMGLDPILLADMAEELQSRGAPRIDLNCGCPSNTVVGRGAGSSLLREPQAIFEIVSSIKSRLHIPLSVKIRSGYTDESLFYENLKAIEDAGASLITLHPRTKKQGYRGEANWQRVAEAKAFLKIPLIGSGDILSGSDAERFWQLSQCDGLMVGRGAIAKPWIFHEMRRHLAGEAPLSEKKCFAYTQLFLKTFVDELYEAIPIQTKVDKMKQLSRFLVEDSDKRMHILRGQYQSPHEVHDRMLEALHV